MLNEKLNMLKSELVLKKDMEVDRELIVAILFRQYVADVGVITC